MWSHDLSHQTEIPSPRSAEKRVGLYPPRLRGHRIDAVRRLWARLDHRFDHPGVFRTLNRTAPRRQDLRHRLLVENSDVLPWQFTRLQLGAWPHAVGVDRGQ